MKNLLHQDVFNTHKIIIFGAGERGKYLSQFLKHNKLQLIFFADNDIKKQNTIIDGIRVVSVDYLAEIDSFDILIIIAAFEPHFTEIFRTLSDKLTKSLIIRDIQLLFSYADLNYSQKIESYNVDYEVKITEWINSIQSEIDFWDNSIYKRRNDKIHRFDSIDRIPESQIFDDCIVMDIGSGPLNKYTNKLNNHPIKYIPVDPLAHFYHKICLKHNVIVPIKVEYGVFEYLSSLFPKDYADIILVDNALDHCIDPFKAVIEMIAIVKKGGLISLRHRAYESTVEYKTGLHQWDIFTDCDNNLILGNASSKINVTQKLSPYVKIDVYEQNLTNSDIFIIANITPISDIPINLLKSLNYYEKYLKVLSDVLKK